MGNEGSLLQQVLNSRCGAIADSWYEAIARTGFVPHSAAEVRQRLVELAEQAVALLTTELFDPRPAQAIGASLARLRYTPPEVLGRAQEVLVRQLVEGLPANQVTALQPRLAALLGGLATGFSRQAEEELKGDLSRLEKLMEERTAQLMSTIEQFEWEVADRKRTANALQQRNQALAMLHRAGRALSSTLDLDQVLSTILEEVRRLLDVVASSVWLVDPKTDELVCRQATGARGDVVRGWRLAPGEGLAGWVARSSESLIVPDVWADSRHYEGVDEITELPLRSVLTIPLHVKEGIVGVLQVVDTEPDVFDAMDLALLEPLAAWAAIAIDNARLVEALRQHAVELEARNEELDAFAHTVAHDLKNPVFRVIGFAEALEATCATMPNEELCSYLHSIAQSGHKMDNIIEALLLLAGVRQMDVELEPLDMTIILAEVQQRLAHTIEEHQAEIILPETWLAAMGYGPWVEEVWINYLSNAIRYGGQPPRVELGASPPSVPPDGGGEVMVRFWVRDNGPGIPPEEQDRLFTPFTRLAQVSIRGHGLGLSIVRRIVEKLGGQVGVESEVGRGSVFSFTLPGDVRRET